MNWLEIVDWLQKQGTLTIVLFIGIVLYLIYRGIIKIPGVKKKKAKNPHAGCEHAHDAQIRISKIMDLRMKSDFILNIERVRMQMDAAELAVDDITATLIRHYLKLLKDIWKSETGLVEHPDYRGYVAILKAWRAEILTIVRHMMRENNIPDNEADLAQYIRIKSGKLMEHTTQFLNDFYDDGFLIKREQLYDSHHGKWREVPAIVPDVANKLHDFFRTAKRIYAEQNAIVKKMEAEIENLLPTKEEGEP